MSNKRGFTVAPGGIDNKLGDMNGVEGWGFTSFNKEGFTSKYNIAF